jgi:hypothetical protein
MTYIDDDTLPLAWYLTTEVDRYGLGSGPIMRVHAEVMRLKDGAPYGTHGSYDEKGRSLHNFQVTATLYDATSSMPEDWSVWRCEYRDVYSIELADAERHVKTLRNVAKKLDTMAGKLGAPSDLGAYLARVGIAIGVTTYLVENTERRREMTGDKYRELNARGMQDWLNDTRREFRKGDES